VRLNAHIQKTLREANGRTMGISLLLEKRVKVEGVLLDLAQLVTVKALAQQLLQRGQTLDAVVWNAGIGGWTGTNWPWAIWTLLTDMAQASTWPTYQYSEVGSLAKQKGLLASEKTTPAPALGQVFAANVFGHYMLTHWLSPLFISTSRIVWIGSITALPHFFSLSDMQCLRAHDAYESSKRLTDLLVLTSDLPSTKPYTQSFFSSQKAPSSSPPKMYITHPGILATSIASVFWLIEPFMIAFFYLARWLGSPWHTVTAYKAAVSPCFCVLAPAAQLEDLEARDGKGKWGSAINAAGDERVARTETEGWGWCGRVGETPSGSVAGSVGRWRGMKVTGKEEREDFEVKGREAWKEMEALRVEWEARLGGVETMVSEDL
jgi:3-keto steroid reductase